jgi:uncharacterized protein GlcG (DUF336 family)
MSAAIGAREIAMRINIRMAWSAGALCASALVFATAAGPFHDQPDSARSLPADNLPPFGMLDAHGNLVPVPPLPAGALHRGPGSAPETNARGPTLALAIEAARTAIDSCAAAGYRVGAAVVDSAGEARAMLTADGADGSHVFVAIRKALVALTFGESSSHAREQVLKDKASLARVTPNMFVEGGAVPIRIGDQVIGAIGVSGAGGTIIGRQDELCAAAGLAKLSHKLR